MTRFERNERVTAGGFVGCAVLVILFNLFIGAVTFDYALYSLFGKDVPWYADMICGLVLAQITVPVAIVCWILRLCGIEAPFFA